MFRSRLAATLLVGALLGTLGPLDAPAPAVAATGSGACASHLVPATRFTDTLGSVHRAAIDCAVWWGLAQGRTSTQFSPAADVTRGQTAAMVARLLRTTGHAPAVAPPAGFVDTVGHTFQLDIDLLASLDIIKGVSATHFAPDRPVTRAQMASFLARTFELGYGSPLPSGPMPFTDVGADDTHRDAIARLVAAEITTGTTSTTFSPSAHVPRAQMASFVTRSANVLLARGFAQRPTTRPGANDAYASRMRGAWVHLFDGTLKTRTNVRALVDELAAADANVIIAQVARRHDAYYVSNVLPRTPDPAVAPGFDVLAELITAAHGRGIEVHAWYGVAPTYHSVYDSLRSSWPAGWMHTTHGMAAPVADRWVSRSYEGSISGDPTAGWSSYLDPGVPGVQAHVASVVAELAANYDLDGVHLDYVRYEAANQGYNPHALTRYRRETGASGTPAPTDARWTDWRRAQTRQIIVRARQAIRSAGKDIPLSAAVITWGDGPSTPDRAGFRRTFSYTRVLQDWDLWVRQGEIDAVMPMNYYRAHDATQARQFASWLAYERALARDVAAQIVPGPAGYLNHPSNVMTQTRAAMAVDGAMIYSYQQPTLDGSRAVWRQLAATRWGYAPTR
jgi:uncharacterized lipoprotein YddW (UPF0748 family)